MVIQCPECQSRFKMADEKAKPGVKVRCSRCQHVFPVQPPAEEPVAPAAAPREKQPAATAASGSAMAAAAGDAVRDDVSGPRIEGFDLADFSVDTEVAADPAPASGRADELDLGDFNTDLPPAASSSEANDFAFGEDSSAAAEFSFGEGETDEVAFDFSAQAPAEEFSFEADSAADTATDADFSADDFSFDTEPGGDPPEAAGEEAFSFQAAENEFSFGDLSPDSAFSFDSPQPAAQEKAIADAEAESTWSSGEGPRDEFDFAPADPTSGAEEFDFSNLSFGEESPAASTAPLSGAASGALPPLAAPPPAPPTEERDEFAFPEDELLMPPPPSRRKSPLGGILGFLIVLLLLLGGVAGYFFWQGEVTDLPSLLARITGKTPPPVAAGQIRVTDLNGYFINNAEVGQLFVIQGRIVNEFPENRSAIAVKGILYNGAGQALVQQTVFSGNLLDENALRTLPFAKIEESMNNQFGDSLSNLNIAPGKSIPFTVVFRNLPSGLAEFTAEVSDSKPGAG